MDKIIKQYDFSLDGDLKLCIDKGVAYQSDMTIRKDYGGDYFGYCQGKYVDKKRKNQINFARCDFIRRLYVPHDYRNAILDIGIGDGSFLEEAAFRFSPHAKTEGIDIDLRAIEWLKTNHRLATKTEGFEIYTMWDVLEHIETPEVYLRHMAFGAWLFLSLPIFTDLSKIRESKHYRPGEHLYYFTEIGLLKYLKEYGFECKDIDDFEIRAGRQDIYNYAFQRISE